MRPVTASMLGKYKLPEGILTEKEEGYDGHLEWKMTEEMIAAMFNFRQAVTKENQETVSEILESLGASENQAQHITSLVVSGSVEQLKEALLSSICIGSRPLTEFILSLFCEWSFEEQSGCIDSEAYPSHITPLVLAAINNNFALVQCLLVRGHSIEMPHHKNCGCESCVRQPYEMLASIEKIDIIRAVSSDAFLWLGSDDPYAAACSLADDLQRFMIEEDLEFTDLYSGFYQNVQHFATRIVNQLWSVQELDLFFCHPCYTDSSTSQLPYPRVQMALRSSMKDVVASTNVQLSMDEVPDLSLCFHASFLIWWRGWGNFGQNKKRDVYRLLRHTLFYPILTLFYILTNRKLATSYDVPLGRYISNCFSYLTFVASLIFVRFARQKTDEQQDLWSGMLKGAEIYVYLYVFGMMFERMYLFKKSGIQVHFQYWWRWFDLYLIGLFQIAAFIWIALWTGGYDPKKRKHMDTWDLPVLYDIWLSSGCILAVWRLFYYVQLHKRFGPSVISVGRCVGYICNYLFIMCVLILSFVVGLTMLQQPYENSRQMEDGKEEEMRNDFASIYQGFRSLYWSLYGYVDFLSYKIIVGNAGPEFVPQEHPLISIATELLIGLFHVIAVIALLNLTVSLLVKKADEVLDNEEMEFKYTKVVIFSEYLDWYTAVPPPFNVIHILLQWIIRSCSSSPNELASEDHCQSYKKIFKRAFLRFWASKEHHYKSVYRAEGAGKPTAAYPKVAFMSNKPKRT